MKKTVKLSCKTWGGFVSGFWKTNIRRFKFLIVLCLYIFGSYSHPIIYYYYSSHTPSDVVPLLRPPIPCLHLLGSYTYNCSVLMFQQPCHIQKKTAISSTFHHLLAPSAFPYSVPWCSGPLSGWYRDLISVINTLNSYESCLCHPL